MGTPILDPHKFDHLTDRQKFVTGDYVGDLYPKTKFGANPPTSGQMREI